MNDIFNIRRFGRYLLSDIKNCAAGYGLSMALICSMGIIIYAGTVLMGLVFKGTWEGPEHGFRFFTFMISMFVLFTSMPVKCYGGITDKRKGTSWIMLPVSVTEKFLSMVIMTAVAAPVVAGGVYMLIDAIICALDPTCGAPIFGTCTDFVNSMIEIGVATNNDLNNFPQMADFVKQVSSPWLYIDDIIMISLIFLMGSILFKKSKTAKTIFSYIAISMAISMIITPMISGHIMEIIRNVNLFETADDVNALFGTWFFRNAALIDTINDTIINVALLTGIFLRIRTLKH